MNEDSNPTAQERAAKGAERVALGTAMDDLVAAVKGGDTHTIEQAGEHLRVAELASWRVQRAAEIADNVAAERVAAEEIELDDDFPYADYEQWEQERTRALAEKLEKFAATRWPTTQAGAMEAVRALLELEGAMKEADYHPAGRTRTGAGDPVTALQDVLREAHPKQMSLAVDDLAVVLDGLVDKLYNRNPVDQPNVQKALRAELLGETKRMAMLPASRVEAAECVTRLVDYVNTASCVPLTPEQEMQAEAAVHEAAAKQAEQETAHQAGVELGGLAPEAGMPESTIASRVEELWTAHQREAAESRRKIMDAHELGGYGLPQSGRHGSPLARGLVMGTVEGVEQSVPRPMEGTTMTDAVRKPSHQTKISPEDRATFDALHSRDAAVRLAAASTPDLSARMIEEALTCHKDVRHAAMRNQRLHESQITYYLTKGSVEDRTLIIENQPMNESQLDPVIHHRSTQVRLALAKRPGLSARATFELGSDWAESVRLATIEHQKIEGLYLASKLQASRGRELRAVIEHQSLTPTQVASLLEDPDPLVRLAVVQHQGLTSEQAGHLLDQYAGSTNAAEQEIRRAAVDRAEPSRLQEATRDPDPVVSERAGQELDDVAAAMVSRVEEAANLSSEEAEQWAQAGQHEIDHEAARKASASARDKEWGFDLAWAERAELISQVGSRPEDPKVELARLSLARDAAAETLARWRQSSGMLPLGYRAILDQQVADAHAEATRAAALSAKMEAEVLNVSHPQVLACAQWDATHGADAERIEELSRQCIRGLDALSREDWSITPVPTTEAEQALHLRLHGEYAAASARVERTGVVSEQDVAARIAHMQMAADVGWSVSRGGFSEELHQKGYGF